MGSRSTIFKFFILISITVFAAHALAQSHTSSVKIDSNHHATETIQEQVVVRSSVNELTLTSPDPSEKILIREELLDANPGRPGAPISIPGLPAETASGGIKAPQYFVPGVAGDHGEPIAQYIAVGNFLVSNNLSANAHGNGYADPNIFISSALQSVNTDGGAYNVLEGNHALNLAATYSFRPYLIPNLTVGDASDILVDIDHITSPTQKTISFVTLTGDYRNLDLTAGLVPAYPGKQAWIAIEAAFGNGLLERLEHRQQYKWNAMRVFHPLNQELSLLSIGYYGASYQGGLVPLGLARQVHDTIDPRQHDQTHTSLIAANDRWTVNPHNELSLSSFFRTYNLALFSNFGEGLIRQSEFRTVEGAEIRETHSPIALSHSITFVPMIGLQYNEDDPRRDNLDHYLSGDPQVYGPFVKVLANNLTIRDVAPYVALQGRISDHLHIYAGLRPDIVELKNSDLLNPSSSYDQWKSILNPKVSLAWTPGHGPLHWLPATSFSLGQAYFTQDPRISVASSATPSNTPFERSHSAQLVLEKTFTATDLRVTLGHTTTTSTLAKIDADTGLAEDQGAGSLKFLTASLRHQFHFGSLQGIFSKADARDQSTGMVTPEAPRTIFDALATLDRLPWSLKARGEYEYVGHKLLDAGGFEAVPVGETRLAVVRPLLNHQLTVGINAMIARGYTGQTTETFTPGWQPGNPPPTCASGIDGISTNFDCGTEERSVGVRLPSFVSASISWRFHQER